MKAIDNFVRKRKQVKADRAMEQGIAGHQAAMKALGNASGIHFSEDGRPWTQAKISNYMKNEKEDE